MAKMLGDIYRTYRRLPASVYLLFVTDAALSAGNFVFPFLSLYLTLNLGLAADRVGLVMGTVTVVCLVSTLLGGIGADRYSRKHVVVWPMLLSALAYYGVPLSRTPSTACSLIVLSLAIMAASRPAYNALVADLTGSLHRRAAFSLLYLGANVGFAIGPLVAGALYHQHVRWLFWGDATMTVLAAGLMAALLDDRSTYHGRGRMAARDGLLPDPVGCDQPDQGVPGPDEPLWRLLVRSRTLWVFAFVYTAHVAIYSQIFFSLPLQVSSLFGAAGPKRYGWMMTLNGISVIALTPWLMHLTRKLSSGLSIALAGMLFAIGLGGYFWATRPATVFGLVLLWTAGEVLSRTHAQALIAERAAPSQRGRLNVLLELAYEIGFGLGPGLAGFITAHHGIHWVWPWVGTIACLSSLAIAAAEWQTHREVVSLGAGQNPLVRTDDAVSWEPAE